MPAQLKSGIAGAIRTSAVTPLVVTAADETLLVDASGGAKAVTLPDPTTVPVGMKFTVKDKLGNAAVNNITVSVAGGATIDGAANKVMNANFATFKFQTDGTSYFVVA